MTTPRRRLAAGVTALVAALLLLGVTAPAASAHAALLTTVPADAEIDAASPTHVSLTFGEEVGAGPSALKVLAATGDRVDTGQIGESDGGREVHVPLRPQLKEGTYVVIWRVVSADSHPVSGTFTFSVGQATALTGYQGRISAPHSPGLVLASTRLLGFAGLLLWLGGALFCLLLWREGLAHRAVRVLLGSAVAVELIAAGAAVLLQGPYAAGLGIGHALDAGLVRGVLHTRYGEATGSRVVLSALGLGAWALLRRAPRPALTALAVLGGVTTVTWSAAGHAGTGVWQPAAAVLDVTHLLATSAWVGGLAVLGLALRGRWDDAVAARVLPQWSRVATWAVGLLVGSGLFAGYREVRSFSALTTAYGGLLSLKVFLVILMMFAGLTGRMWVRQHYGVPATAARGVTVVHAAVDTPPDTGAGAGSAVRPPPDATAVAILRRSVRSETVLAAVVLAVTAVLVQSPPAATAYAPPYTGTSAAGPYKVQVDFYPAHKGLNELHLYTLGPHGHTEDVAEVTGTMTRPDGETFTVRPLHKSLGHYEDLHVVLPATGSYVLTLQVRATDVDSYATTQTVRVR